MSTRRDFRFLNRITEPFDIPIEFASDHMSCRPVVVFLKRIVPCGVLYWQFHRAQLDRLEDLIKILLQILKPPNVIDTHAPIVVV